MALVVLPAMRVEIALAREAVKAEPGQSEQRDKADEKKIFDVYWDAGLHLDGPWEDLRWSIGALQPETDDLSLKNTDNLGYSGRFAAAFHRGAEKKTLLHLGVDFWRRNVEDTFEIATRPESHIAPDFVDTGEIASQHLVTTLLEVGAQRGPLAFQSEFAGTHLSTQDQGTLFFHAFYLQGSYFLTGETRPYRSERGTFSRPKPIREFRGGSGGLGAFELGVRFSRIDLENGAVTGGRLDDWSFAFNWYPSYYAQVMSNFIVANLANAEPVAIFQMRLQVAF
jgi:phosphate-selective porin OprO/OprP